MRQILFVQGGGADVHDTWDNKLVDSLRRELGPGYEIRYPRMPNEGDPSFPAWRTALEEDGQARTSSRTRTSARACRVAFRLRCITAKGTTPCPLRTSSCTLE